MATKAAAVRSSKSDAQEVCIDLPGEAVQCWRSSDKIKVILRKHRDVFFDINLAGGSSYTVESKCDFYCPRDKKLLRKVEFRDGEVLHVWVGREFAGVLELKSSGRLLGTYRVNELDTTNYGADPKTKPEPLMVVIGQSIPRAARGSSLAATHGPQNEPSWGPILFKPQVDRKFAKLPSFGSSFHYTLPDAIPENVEYVALTEATAAEIKPAFLGRLERGEAVVGTVQALIVDPASTGGNSRLYRALGVAASYIAGNEILTSTPFKETAGYLQEHFRQLDKLGMTVRIEGRLKGKYRVAIKGPTLSSRLAKAMGRATNARTVPHRTAMGTEEAKFVDGGFARSGKVGYGGFKRVFLTSAENFKAGLKVQVIGTMIDIFVDANTVFFDKNGSHDWSEFLGRVGVSLMKAAMSAALGGLFVAGLFALAGLTFGAVPVAVAMVLAVGGYMFGAFLVDKADELFEIKEYVARAAR
jgi:hypothetical protein